MKKVNKKLVSVLIIMACVIIGGTLSFESLARFSKKFADNQTISTDKFKVDVVNTFKDLDKIVPGENPIAEDTITLSNNNSYPVEFTVKLKSENIVANKDLLKYLKLIIKIDDETKELQDQYIVRVQSGEEKVIIATVEWNLDENGEVDADIAEEATVKYSYDIKAKQLSNGESSSGGVGEETKDDTNLEEGTEEGVIVGDSNNEEVEENKEKNSLTLKDISWETATNNVEVNNEYTIIKGNTSTVLDKFIFDLKNEKITFNADLEILKGIDEIDEGVNFCIGLKENVESSRNRLIYQLYRNQNNIYARITNNEVIIAPNRIPDNGEEPIKSLQVKLNGEIFEKDNYIYSKVSFIDKDGTEVCAKEIKCGQYKVNDKIYISINNIIGKEGIKINSMNVKAIAKQ